MGSGYRCAECGSTVPSLTSDELCPHCLLTLGLSVATEPEEAPNADTDRFGPYRVIGLLGEGGMGSVYLAEQEEPIRREVALKVIKPGMDTREVIARFQSERQALAILDHPGIAHVYDAGCTPDGRPYFAMEYVQGERITQYCDQRRLTVRQRVAVFVQLCEAVQHAHQKGILHRDLKPSNVLVTEFEKTPSPKVIDFGLAKALHQPLTLESSLTRQGVPLGTPEYMSPEQASGKGVDTRTDVYSLGLILYELASGVLPFDVQARKSPHDEVLRAIRRQDLPNPRLGRRLSATGPAAESLASARSTDVTGLRHQLRGELDWITAKALEKDRARRYQSVSELLADCAAYLTEEPVSAGPQSAAYRVRKWVSRHRAGVAAAVLVALCAVGAGILSGVLYLRAEAARRVAVEQQYVAAINAAALNLAAGDPDEARHHLYSCNPALRGWEWRHLMYRCDPSLSVMRADGSFAPGSHPSTFGIRQNRLLWNTATSVEEFSLDGKEHTSHHGLGDVLAVDEAGMRAISRGADGKLTIYALDPFGPSGVLDPKGRRVTEAAFAPAPDRAGTGSQDGRLQVWNTITGKLVAEWQAHNGPVTAIVFFPDGKRVATAARDGYVRVWNVQTSALVSTVARNASPEWPAAVTPSSRWLAFPSRDSVVNGQDIRVRIYDLEEASIIRSYPSSLDVAAIAFNTAVNLGSQYGFVNHAGELQICAETDGCTVLKRHTNDLMNSVVFGADGAVAYTGSESGEVAAWDAHTRGGTFLPGGPSPLTAVAFDPSGKRMIAAGEDHQVGIWSTFNGYWLAEWGDQGSAVRSVAVSAYGQHVASGGEDGLIRIWNRAGQLQRTLCGHRASITALAFQPRRPVLASASADGSARLWDIASGRPIGELRHGSAVNAVAFDGGGNTLLTGSNGPGDPLRLWDAQRLTAIRSLPVSSTSVSSLAFSPDGEHILAGSADGVIWVYDRRSGRVVNSMHGHSAAVRSLAFIPDGSRLASGSDDTTVRVWDARSWRQLLVLRGHRDAVHTVAFAPNGSRIYSAGGLVRMWSTRQSVRWPHRGRPAED